jgi:antitoxin component YwqK of YwqJK toxin-antitoxin module
MEADIEEFNDFDKTRHLRPRIDKVEFYQQAGFDFGWLLLEPLSIGMSLENEAELAKRLSPGQKALYFWWYLDAEVTNGGFVQFFFNAKDKYLPAIINGLEFIGDKEMAGVVREARRIYLQNLYIFENARVQEEIGSELYEQLDELSHLDGRYYALNKLTMARIEKFARQHPNEFCVDENGSEFSQNITGVVESHFSNGNIKTRLNVIDGIVDGECVSFYDNGNQHTHNFYKMGQQVGEQKVWYEDGTLKGRIFIDSTSGNKTKEEFYSNGLMKKLESTDKYDDLNGICKDWYDNGQLKEECEFIGGMQRTGPWLKYHRNGQIEQEAEFRDGDLFFHNYWTKEGEQLLKNGTGLYVNEYEIDMFGEEMNYRDETEYIDYKRNGLSKSYLNGTIQLKQHFKDDVQHGTAENYDNGKLIEIKVYEMGELLSSKRV